MTMLDQQKYVKRILPQFKMSDYKPTKSPFVVGLKFKEKMEEFQLVLYFM